MSNFLNELKRETAKGTTENGAVTYKTSLNDCVDLFAQIGACRNRSESEIETLFKNAYGEDALIALKTMFFARDIRGGLGERRAFRIMLKSLAVSNPQVVIKNLPNIVEFGRWDDIRVLLDTPAKKSTIEFIKSQLNKDLEDLKNDKPISLMAKWLPSVNTSSEETRKDAFVIAKGLGLNPATYRKTLSKLRNKLNLIESNLSSKDYSFDYESIPSKAMIQYRQAFYRNDGDRYAKYLEDVNSGSRSMNTTGLFPYELVRPLFEGGSTEEKSALDVAWKNLPNYVSEDENAIVVSDGSGSMYGSSSSSVSPICVAVSLAIYFAERNKGAFANHFITFSTNPKLVEIKGDTLLSKVNHVKRYNEVADTNIEAVFDLVLTTAVANKTPQSELPSKIFIISDMEFNYCAKNASKTVFENAKEEFEKAGYKLPSLVFWNVDARQSNMPVTMDERGVALVSGCSPSIFQSAMNEDFTPYSFMMEKLNNPRYDSVII